MMSRMLFLHMGQASLRLTRSSPHAWDKWLSPDGKSWHLTLPDTWPGGNTGTGGSVRKKNITQVWTKKPTLVPAGPQPLLTVIFRDIQDQNCNFFVLYSSELWWMRGLCIQSHFLWYYRYEINYPRANLCQSGHRTWNPYQTSWRNIGFGTDGQWSRILCFIYR